jgi:hypothetical protein
VKGVSVDEYEYLDREIGDPTKKYVRRGVMEGGPMDGVEYRDPDPAPPPRVPSPTKELAILHRLTVVLAPLLALVLLLPAPAAQAAKTRTLVDPAGDVATTPIVGFTPTGPPAWADLLKVTYTVTKGDNLTITIQTADLPETAGPGELWGVEGKVTLPDGRTRSLNAWIQGDGEHYAGIGSSCGSSGSVSAPTNTVVVMVDFSRCLRGAAKVRLRAKGMVKGAKTVGLDNLLQPLYTDDTAFRTLRVK